MLECKNRIFIFAEYMHKSWWYGYKIQNDESYVIGILPDENTFKPFAPGLSEFIEMYIDNCSKLYEF
jgi:hypothetical protein